MKSPKCANVHLSRRFLTTKRKRTRPWYPAMNSYKLRIGVASGARSLPRGKKNYERSLTTTKWSHVPSSPRSRSVRASRRKTSLSWRGTSPGKSALDRTSNKGWPRMNLNNDKWTRLDLNWARIQKLSTSQSFIMSAKLKKIPARKIVPWSITNT